MPRDKYQSDDIDPEEALRLALERSFGSDEDEQYFAAKKRDNSGLRELYLLNKSYFALLWNKKGSERVQAFSNKI